MNRYELALLRGMRAGVTSHSQYTSSDTLLSPMLVIHSAVSRINPSIAVGSYSSAMDAPAVRVLIAEEMVCAVQCPSGDQLRGVGVNVCAAKMSLLALYTHSVFARIMEAFNSRIQRFGVHSRLGGLGVFPKVPI
jgi:hypothetical protein